MAPAKEAAFICRGQSLFDRAVCSIYRVRDPVHVEVASAAGECAAKLSRRRINSVIRRNEY